MAEAGMWNWRRLRGYTSGLLLMLGGTRAFWAHREQGESTREVLRSGESPPPPPVAYQTLTTTSKAGDVGVAGPELAWNWHYDAEDRLVEVLGPGGVTTSVIYASVPPKPGATTVGERRIFARDARGRLLSAEDPSGKVTFSYGSSGLPTEVRLDGVPSLHYAYDVFGRLSAMQIGDRRVVQYRYDFLGRLAAFATPAGDITYSYNKAANTVVRRLPNGVQTVRKYDDEGILIELTHINGRNQVLAGFAYAYRPDCLIATITETTQRHAERVWRYTYDLMHRLTAVECRGDGLSYSYRYDALGNLIESRTAGEELRFTSTAAGALASDSRGASRVDARGHMRQLPSPEGTLEYAFTSVGELAAVKSNAVQYSYNALGLLTARVQGGRTTRYLPDPFADAWRPLWQRDADGIETMTVWEGAVPLVELQGDTIAYRLEDHLASVRVEVDSRGQPVAWHDYAPYGAPLASSTRDALKAGFAGLFWDPTAKVYHVMARAYDPVTARFLQPDPEVRVPDTSKHSHSLYTYGGGDPVNFADRNGARARETVSFDAHDRWWDSFGRFVPKDHQSPRAVTTDPTVRDSMVAGLVGEAWKRSGQDISKAHTLVKNWREHRQEPPASYKNAATAQEFRAAENYLYARQWVETGHGLIQTPKGPLSAMFMRLIGNPGWALAHKIGETRGIPPGVFLRPFGGDSNDEQWLPDTPESRAWRNRGVTDALGNMTPRRAVSRGPSESVWQKIDHFLVTPAYGDEIPTNRSTPEPSPVGGVFLGGAGQTLEGFSHLRGVAIDDASGKLILIGSDEQRIALPPLRLDEIITVFRAVFEHGQAPTVTIDPDTLQPTGPIMHVKHGPGTASSYVGWILYECDRVMKTYNLGSDNVTGATLTSRVPGYATTLDAVYFGHSGPKETAGSVWERFWIVPAEVIRFDASKSDLSLFELPLKVNTQKMRWEHGQLVDDPRGVSSFGARTFQQWFSQQYDAIADEVVVKPPPGSGVDTPVAIFHELRRIATIAAVAERLRDLGHTLPTWMREYRVALFPVPLTTPALRLRQTKEDGSGIRVAQIYGGVNLAPADRDVHIYRDGTATRSSSVPREHRAFVEAAAHTAAWLTPKIEELARATDSVVTVRRIAAPDGTKLSIGVLPGAMTHALIPNRQQVSDLVVPIGSGRQISLMRSYNSFFDPAGEFGRGWVLDLPRLTMAPVPVRRDGGHTQYRLVPHVHSPLGTIDIRVERAETALRDHPKVTSFGRGHNAIPGGDTYQLILRDGATWHFDDDGRLLLVQNEGTATRYVWGTGGRLVQIVGYVGTDAVAEITLDHDEQGRIVEASATQTTQLRKQAPALVSKVTFEYGENGRLVRVTHPAVKNGDGPRVQWSYSYNADCLMTIGGSVDLSFGYDERGRLLWEQQGDQKTRYTLTSTSQGTVLRKATSKPDGHEETWTFDTRMRPLEEDLGDGELVRWQYGTGSEVTETYWQAGRSVATRSTSQDGHTETTVVTDGPTYRVQRDAPGRPTDVSVNGVGAARISWAADGTLTAVRMGDTEVHPRRTTDGRQTGVLITAPMDRGRTTQWLEQIWDVMGRPTTITDSSGFKYSIEYDEYGRVQAAGRVTDHGMLIGARVAYDDNNRVTRIQSSWGTETRAYSEAAALSHVEVTKLGATSETWFDGHRHPTRHVAFDGGITTWQYGTESDQKLRAVELPSGERIEYVWRSAAEVQEIALGSALIRTRFDPRGRVAAITWGGRFD